MIAYSHPFPPSRSSNCNLQLCIHGDNITRRASRRFVFMSSGLVVFDNYDVGVLELLCLVHVCLIIGCAVADLLGNVHGAVVCRNAAK